MNDTQPAAVVSICSLEALAVQMNAEFHAGQDTERASLTHYRKVGEILLAAKQQCKHGKWLPWLKANAPFSRMNANRYMRLAKCSTVLHLEEQWAIITGRAEPEPDEPEPTGMFATPATATAPDRVTESGSVAKMKAAIADARAKAKAVVRLAAELDAALRVYLASAGGDLLLLMKARDKRNIVQQATVTTRVRGAKRSSRLFCCVASPAELADALKRALPVDVCAGCLGRRAGCTACKQFGFIPVDEELARSRDVKVFEFTEPPLGCDPWDTKE